MDGGYDFHMVRLCEPMNIANILHFYFIQCVLGIKTNSVLLFPMKFNWFLPELIIIKRDVNFKMKYLSVRPHMLYLYQPQGIS